MPIVTRSTVDYMKSQGISSMGDDEVSENSEGGGGNSKVAATNGSSTPPTTSSEFSAKRIRETPSCLDSVATDAKSTKTEMATSKKKPSTMDRVSSSKSSLKSKSKTRPKSSKTSLKSKSHTKCSTADKSTAHSKSSETSIMPTSKISPAPSTKSRTESSKTSLKSKTRPKSTDHKSRSHTKSKSADHKSKSRPKSSKTSLKSKTNCSPPKSKKSAESDKKSQDNPFSLSNFEDYTKIPWSKKKYLYVLTLLKSATKNFNELRGAEPVTEQNASRFAAYKVDKSKPVNKPHSCKALYETIHKDYPDCPIVCKLYDTDRLKPDSHYLRMLEHLGKKYPSVIQTWDVFLKDELIYLFQEMGFHGNMSAYIATNGALDETKAKCCAMQIYQALEFLGDMAVCHRSIKPGHILLSHQKDMRIKLTGFRQAIIYWGIAQGKKEPNVLLQPCVPLHKRPKTEPDYQALEIYGDPSKEEFDPICADVWSMGASIYYLLTGKYPYCYSKENPNIEHEIHKNVREVKVHKNGRNLLSHCLTVYSTKRLNAAHLGEHPWLKDE